MLGIKGFKKLEHNDALQAFHQAWGFGADPYWEGSNDVRSHACIDLGLSEGHVLHQLYDLVADASQLVVVGRDHHSSVPAKIQKSRDSNVGIEQGILDRRVVGISDTG